MKSDERTRGSEIFSRCQTPRNGLVMDLFEVSNTSLRAVPTALLDVGAPAAPLVPAPAGLEACVPLELPVRPGADESQQAGGEQGGEEQDDQVSARHRG